MKNIFVLNKRLQKYDLISIKNNNKILFYNYKIIFYNYKI